MPPVFEQGSDEYEYIMNGIRSGQHTQAEICHVIVMARLSGKTVQETASALMDAKIGFQQVWRDYIGLVGEN